MRVRDLVLACGLSAGVAAVLYGQAAYPLMDQALHAEGKQRVALLEQAAASDPGSAKAQYLLGKALAETHEYARALAAFESAESHTQTPSFQAVALFQQARMCVALGDVAKAKMLAGRSQERFATPEDKELLRELGVGETVLPAEAIVQSLESTNGSRSLVLENEGEGVGHAIDLPIEFDFGQERMTPSGRRQAEELGKAIANPSLHAARFLVIGHTDNRGGTDYNQALSERRARAVVVFLTSTYGVDSGRFQTVGRGSREPLVQGDSEEIQQLNRRVEIQAILP